MFLLVQGRVLTGDTYLVPIKSHISSLSSLTRLNVNKDSVQENVSSRQLLKSCMTTILSTHAKFTFGMENGYGQIIISLSAADHLFVGNTTLHKMLD